MRVYIGGQATLVPARWYFTDPSFPLFASPHGCEASPWLKNFEVNESWGEVAGPRGLDRGFNPGYQGECFVGDPQWFVDGQLPADILSRPAPDFPLCCFRGPALGSGDLVLTASPIVAAALAYSASGDLVLTALPIVAVTLAYSASGDLVLTGAPVLAVTLAYSASGDLVLTGAPVLAVELAYRPVADLVLTGSAVVSQRIASGSGSGSGSGETVDGCEVCPDGAARQYSFSVPGLTNGVPCTDCAVISREWVVTYGGGTCVWQTPSIAFCGVTTVWTFSLTGGLAALTLASDALYQTSSAGWDCKSPLTLPRQSVSARCGNWPSTITIFPV